MAGSQIDSKRRKQGRGFAWSHSEVLDLISLWGDEHVQQKLNSNHRNLDVYEAISAQMGERGHARTAFECRNKCKTLKSEYQKVANRNKISCPYFSELEQFLNADRTVSPKRLSKTLQIKRTRSLSMEIQENSQLATASMQDASSEISFPVEAHPTPLEEHGIVVKIVEDPEPSPQEQVANEQHVPEDFQASQSSSEETDVSDEFVPEDPVPGPSSAGSARQHTQENALQHGPTQESGAGHRRARLAEEENENLPDRRARRGELIALSLMEDSQKEGRLNRKLYRTLHSDFSRELLQRMDRDSAVLQQLAESYMEDIANTERHRRELSECMQTLNALAKGILEEQQRKKNNKPGQQIQ